MRLSTFWHSATLVAASLCCFGARASDAAADPGLAQRIFESADHRGRPFAIVDKRAATLTVYLGDGRLAGTTPALLGQTPGDRSMPGVGERAQAGRLRADDRSTPAGRFDSEPGHNLAGEAIVWIDYASALAIHRVRPGPSQGQRVRGLASADARDRRLSAGCVVVPEAFFDAVVQPVLGRGPGVVYVMPEDSPVPLLLREARL